MRRTPALTAQARALFEQELRTNGWQLGATCARIADSTGLTTEQVRDSIFSDSAQTWRVALAESLREEKHAVHQR